MYMNKRTVKNKPKSKKCEICGKTISLYSFSSHLKWSHKISSDEYVDLYGEFRKQKSVKNERLVNKKTCELCRNVYSTVGFFGHLRDSHGISIDKYVQQFGEYRPSKLRQIEYSNRLLHVDDIKKQKCLICNEEFASGNLLGGHIKKSHKICKKIYICEHVFKNEHPLCKCGCGKKVKLLNYYPYKNDYVTGHNSNGLSNPMYGKRHNSQSVKKMSSSAVERMLDQNLKTIDTEPELLFESLLNKFNIKYQHPYVVKSDERSMVIDFYLIDYDLYIEIDGIYWHPDKLGNLNFKLLSSVISDKQKNEQIKNIKRIRTDVLDKLINSSVDEKSVLLNIEKYNTVNNIDIKYDDIIIDKNYFKNIIDSNGKEYVESFVWLLKKFIHNFQKQFPYPSLNENLLTVMEKIQTYDITQVYDESTNSFLNNISSIGNNYLKHGFKSYWASRYKNNLSPKDAWNDVKILNDIIKYRIGCNESNEIFDFSLKEIIKGMSARRITVSFFKPLLAAAIYHKYIGNKTNPIVLDPCCGFGGRLLGFKSKYPNGTYIGCEPNYETYNELQKLIQDANWNDVKIFNCKFEDFESDVEFDLIFTSIPYFDLEIYSNHIKYNSFDDWKNTFIKSFERYSDKNCYINISEDLSIKCGWTKIDSYIQSNRSHFDKRTGYKTELIVRI